MSRRPSPPGHRRCREDRALHEMRSELRALRFQLAALGDQLAAGARATPHVPAQPDAEPAATADLHERRVAAYARLRERLLADVVRVVPEGAAIAVISRGDDELLRIPDRVARHFPATPDGTWAGHHPADSSAAIAALAQHRAAGTDHLVVPASSAWWLTHYAGFRAHLERTGRLVLRSENGVVLALDADPANGPAPQHDPSPDHPGPDHPGPDHPGPDHPSPDHPSPGDRS